MAVCDRYIFPGIFNIVELMDLEPSTRYYYSVGSEVLTVSCWGGSHHVVLS